MRELNANFDAHVRRLSNGSIDFIDTCFAISAEEIHHPSDSLA